MRQVKRPLMMMNNLPKMKMQGWQHHGLADRFCIYEYYMNEKQKLQDRHDLHSLVECGLFAFGFEHHRHIFCRTRPSVTIG
jgi:hypothetical protein